jgi:hypothetical protein
VAAEKEQGDATPEVKSPAAGGGTTKADGAEPVDADADLLLRVAVMLVAEAAEASVSAIPLYALKMLARDAFQRVRSKAAKESCRQMAGARKSADIIDAIPQMEARGLLPLLTISALDSDGALVVDGGYSDTAQHLARALKRDVAKMEATLRLADENTEAE